MRLGKIPSGAPAGVEEGTEAETQVGWALSCPN